MHVELVVFDMAGTTVHDEDNVGGALRDALAAVGVDVPLPRVNAVMGWSKPLAIRTLIEQTRGPTSDDEVAHVHRDFVARMIDHYRRAPGVREIPGTSGVFRWLKERGIHVAVDTGFSRPIADAVLERMRWVERGLLDVSVTSDEVARGRPHPDMIHVAMNRMRVFDPARVVKVGDTPADVQEGRAAGAGCVVAVTRGTHTRDQLAMHSPDLLLPTVASLPGALLGVLHRPRRLASVA